MAGFPCKLDRLMPSGSMTQQPWGHFRFECRVGRSSVFVFRSFVRFKRVVDPIHPGLVDRRWGKIMRR
jgi:hypothetical protein